jgi:hypothetical protein
MATTIPKDPEAVLDYGRDWSPWLETGDTITSSEWSVPAELTVVADGHTGTITTVWLSGGVRGIDYKITNKITTAQGRTDERSMVIQVADR